MIRGKDFLSDQERTLEKRLSLRISALGIVKPGKVVQAQGQIGVKGSGLFGNRYRLLRSNKRLLITFTAFNLVSRLAGRRIGPGG